MTLKRKTDIELCFGFPVSVEDGSTPSRQGKRRGIALLIAMMAVMIMMSLVTDSIVSSMVNVKLAMAVRDRIKSEYLVKSGMNLGIFVASISWGRSLFEAQPNSPLGGPQEMVDDDTSIWNMTNSLPPIGSYLVDLISQSKDQFGEDGRPADPFNLASVFSDKIAAQMRLFEDQFSIKIIDESRKINVNACYTGYVGPCKRAIDQLLRLFSCPAEKLFLEEKNLTPEEIVYRIRDFISNSKGPASPESGFSDRDAPYQAHVPPYRAKRYPFDTVDELKLVEGWDEKMHEVFSPYITVYPYPSAGDYNPKINLNTIDVSLLGCLIPESQSEACANSFILTLHRDKQGKKPVVKGSIKDFLEKTACYAEGSGDSKVRPVTWFDIKSPVLRIQVDGVTGEQDRQLTVVIRRILPKDKSDDRGKQKVKRSYQVLHWKMR